MSPLFRRSEEKAAQKAAADGEIERLRALSVDDLAADLLPGLGTGWPHPRDQPVASAAVPIPPEGLPRRRADGHPRAHGTGQ